MAFIVAARLIPIALLAASAAIEFTNEVQSVPAGKWGYIDLPVHGQAARISGSFEVLKGSTQVRLSLVSHEDLDPTGDDPPPPIVASGAGRTGRIDDAIRRHGDYAVVLDNREGKQAAEVHLRVWLDERGPDPKSPIPRRQLTVIAISCVAFLGIVAFSAKRLRKAMRT